MIDMAMALMLGAVDWKAELKATEVTNPVLLQKMETAKKICAALESFEEAYAPYKLKTIRVDFSGAEHIECTKGTKDVTHDRPARPIQGSTKP